MTYRRHSIISYCNGPGCNTGSLNGQSVVFWYDDTRIQPDEDGRPMVDGVVTCDLAPLSSIDPDHVRPNLRLIDWEYESDDTLETISARWLRARRVRMDEAEIGIPARMLYRFKTGETHE